MTEQQIQSKIIKRYEDAGWYVIKLAKTNKNGIPDILCLKSDDVLFIEVKRNNGILSPLQEYRIEELKKNDLRTIILTE